MRCATRLTGLGLCDDRRRSWATAAPRLSVGMASSADALTHTLTTSKDYFKLTEGGRGRSRRQATQEQDKEVEELLARWRAEDKAKSEADWARLKEQLKERLGRSE